MFLEGARPLVREKRKLEGADVRRGRLLPVNQEAVVESPQLNGSGLARKHQTVVRTSGERHPAVLVLVLAPIERS